MIQLRFTGSLKYLLLFDVGQEIDLKEAEKILESSTRQRFRLNRPAKSVVIDEAPLVMKAPIIAMDGIAESQIELLPTIKLWNFGALCLSFSIEIKEEISLTYLTGLADRLENSLSLREKAIALAEEIIRALGQAVRLPAVSNRSEDYLVFIHKPQSYENLAETFSELLNSDEFGQLILTDPMLLPSASSFESLRSQVLKYSRNDFVLIDWNSAFICSEGDSEDIVEVLEFVLCQLLELQYYDNLLDKKLSYLYRSIAEPNSTLLRSPYAKLAQEAALIYMEISEIVEKIENSLKVTGDFYYARLFRVAVDRFRTRDWQQSVAKKLKSLNDVALLLQSEVHAKRTLLLEATIVILIAIEVVPFLYKSFF